MAVGGMHTKFPLSYSRVPLKLEGTLGVDTGTGSDGVHFGTQTPTAPTKYIAQDYGAGPGVLTDETAGSTLTLFPAAPAVNDAYYLGGGAAKFYGANIQIATAGTVITMTTVWEYWNGIAWATLTTTLDESTGLQVSGTGSKKLRFVPPTDWATCAVTSTGPVVTTGYWIRCRISAFTSITIVPVGTRATTLLVDLTHITGGYPWSAAGAITGAHWDAVTKSGSTADSVFLLVNTTRGTCVSFTITKATKSGDVTAFSLGVSENDKIVIVQIQEDASTEFATMQLWFKQRV